MVRASLDLLSYCWKTFIKNFDCTVAAVFCRRARRLNWSAVALVNLANGLRYSPLAMGMAASFLNCCRQGIIRRGQRLRACRGKAAPPFTSKLEGPQSSI